MESSAKSSMLQQWYEVIMRKFFSPLFANDIYYCSFVLLVLNKVVKKKFKPGGHSGPVFQPGGNFGPVCMIF